MTPQEAVRLLRSLSILDPRLSPVNETDAQARAVMWARMINPDITYAEAGAACEEYYRHAQRWALTPGAINDIVAALRSDERQRSVLREIDAPASPPTSEYLAAKAALFGGSK